MHQSFQHIQTLDETEQYLISLADNMASAATTFNSHGYEVFLQARSQFIQQLHEVLKPEYKETQ